jgi:hypothetical protein
MRSCWQGVGMVGVGYSSNTLGKRSGNGVRKKVERRLVKVGCCSLAARLMHRQEPCSVVPQRSCCGFSGF